MSKLDSNIRIIEGDILINESQFNEAKKNRTRFKRKIANDFNKLTGESTRWPNGIVPYEINKDFRKLKGLFF